METTKSYQSIISDILTTYASVPYAHGDVERQVIIDQVNDHYLIMLIGRDGIRRIHGCLIHVDVISNKVYVQRDGTEEGIATMLVEAGIPKEHIVLAFRSPAMREQTEFATA